MRRCRLYFALAVAVAVAVAVGGAGVSAATGDETTGIIGGDTITAFADIAKFGLGDFSGDGGPATRAELYTPRAVAVDGQGNVYVAEERSGRVRRVTPGGTISTVAGGGPGFDEAGDSGPATQAALGSVWSVAVDGQGNLYIVRYGDRIYRVSPGGTLTTFAGGGIEIPG